MAKKREDGYYCTRPIVGTDINGKPIRKAFYSRKSLKDAKEKANQWIIDQKVSARTGDVVQREKTIRFADIARVVLELKRSKIKQNTWELKWKHVIDNHLVPYFGECDINSVRKNHIEKYFIEKSDLTYETLKVHYTCLSEIFRNADDNGYIERNPMTNFKLSVGQKSSTKRTYTADQARQVMEYARTHRFGLDIMLLLGYGLTVSELLGLKYEDFDAENLTLQVQRGVTRVEKGLLISDTKNKYRNRLIPVSSEVAKMISDRQSISRSEYIICNKNDTVCRPDTWRTRHYKVFMSEFTAEHEDIPALNPHELRHTRTSLWVAENKNLYAIAEVLGWTDLEMLTKIYAHRDISAIRSQLEIE